MAIKFINTKTIIILVSIVILILVVLILGLNAKARLILQENKNLASNLGTLNARVVALSKKLQETISEADRQRSELEETRNKLTQERLRNTQLLQQIEELKAGASSMPEEPTS